MSVMVEPNRELRDDEMGSGFGFWEKRVTVLYGDCSKLEF